MTIRKSIRVERSPEVSFKVFCEEMGAWWPRGFTEGSKVSMESRLGGRFVEMRADGTVYEIGRLTAYQPPHLVAFTWRAPSWDNITTQVEVRFSAEGNGTRIELEHTGWEQAAQTREARKNYDGGWDTMLGHFQRHCNANP